MTGGAYGRAMVTRAGSRIRGAATIAIALLALAGCGSSSPSSRTAAPKVPEVNLAGDIPDNQAYVAYRPPGGIYSLKVPEGWSQTTTGGAVTFTDKLNSIRMEQAPAPAALTASAAKSTELPRLARAVRGFRPGAVTVVRRPAGSAVRITYLATSRPDPVTGRTTTDAVERYVLFHQGHRVVLTLSGPKGADNVDPWKLVSSSVRWTR